MHFLKNSLVVAFFTWFIVPATAQQIHFKYFDYQQHLKGINQIYKSQNGTIYVVSAKGLFVQHNDTIVPYCTQKVVRTNKMIDDPNGNIWLGSYLSSITKISPNKQTQTIDLLTATNKQPQLITSLATDSIKVWFTTSEGNIGSINRQTLEVKKEKSPFNAHIYALLIDYNNQHWLSTIDGLYFKHNDNEEWEKIKDFSLSYGIFNNQKEYWTVGRDKKHKAVLMYLDNYLTDFSRKRKQVWEELELKNLPNLYARFNSLSFDSKNNIWIATDDGIVIYNPFTGMASSIHPDNFPDFSIKNVTNIVHQNDSTVWVSSEGARLLKITYKK